MSKVSKRLHKYITEGIGLAGNFVFIYNEILLSQGHYGKFGSTSFHI